MEGRVLSVRDRIHPNDTILFQGDSVTNAFRMPDEITNAFRMPDEINNAYQLGAGYALMIAAHLLASRPGDGLRFLNRGICGNRLPDLLARWQTDCIDLRPTMLSLLIGINDTAHNVGGKLGSSLAEFARDYRNLLEWTRRELPTVRFVLCEPFTLLAGNVTPVWRENLLPRQDTVRELAGEFGAVFVPLQKPFDEACGQAPAEYWIYDGIHPTAAGFGLIARQWLAAGARA